MLYILYTIIAILFGTVIWLFQSLKRTRREHSVKMDALRSLVPELLEHQRVLSGHVAMSDSLQERLFEVRKILDTEFMGLEADHAALVAGQKG